MAQPELRKIASVEALRGAAASAVVLSHVARHVNRSLGAPLLLAVFQPGHAGVDLFFVISGFIILNVHRHDIGRPSRLKHYLSRRVTRVLPMYWLALLVTVMLGAIGSTGLPRLGNFVLSLLLVPTAREPILGIAWTLQFEIMFYLVFAVLIANRLAGLVLAAMWLAWIAATAAGLSAPDVPPALDGAFCVEFFLGMAAAQLLHVAVIPAARVLAALGLGLFALAFVLESRGVIDGFATYARLCYGIPACLMVLGFAAAELPGTLAVPKWLRTLGGASYSIYLFQFIFIGLLWQALIATGAAHALPKAVIFMALAASALIGGMLTTRLIERPLLRLMRRGRESVDPVPAAATGR